MQLLLFICPKLHAFFKVADSIQRDFLMMPEGERLMMQCKSGSSGRNLALQKVVSRFVVLVCFEGGDEEATDVQSPSIDN